MQKTFKRVLAVGLATVMAASAFTISAAAYDKNYVSETHDVFKHTEQTLAPGVEYYNNYAYLKDGEQVVYYAAVADINRDDVLVQGGYWNAQTEQYGMSKLTEQAAAATAKFADPSSADFISENYTVVAGTNGDFYNMQTGRPSGAFAINGKIMNNANNRPWFAIFEDGTALCGANDTDYNAAIAAHGAVQNSVGGSQMLVVNGEDVTASASGSYNTERHSRTMIGVTADNKVVSVVVDGRQSPFSDGGTMHELAQIMLEAECVTAINLDGGGSTTFGARPEGEDSFKVINRPSDGSERSISSGVLIVSLAAPSNVFDRVSMTVADEYVTPGTSTTVDVAGVSTSGASADIPAEVTYEATNGTFADGVFTAGNAAEDAVISAVYNGEVVGTATVHVVVPESIEFAQATFTVPYGKSMELGIVAKYGLNTVVTKPADFIYTLETPEGAGEIVDGAMVAPDEESGAAANTVTATLVYDDTKIATANIAFGKASQVIFDFEDGTTQKWVRYNTSNYNYILTRGTTSNVTAENGQVHSGEHALKVTAKFSETWEAGYVSGRAGVKGMDEVIDLKGATRLGMWVYLPVELKTFNGRIFLCKVTGRDEETGEITNWEGYYTQTKIDGGGDWNCGFITQYDEPGWHYIYFDLSTDTDWCIIKNATLLDFYINDRNGDSYGFNHLDYTNQNSDLIFYIDDVTVDYSSVVEDRERPVFSSVLLGDDGPHSNEGLVLTNGYESDGYGRLDLSARVADDTTKSNYSGINAASAKVYLDGVEFPCTYANGIMTAPTYTFTNGKHTVKFSIADNTGNVASAIRTFTVTNTDKDQPVWIEAKDPDADKILLGSLYWVNVKAQDAAALSSVNLDLDLDNLSNWELDHMEVAQGFDADYEISNADENIATLTITRNSDEIALLDGDAIVSMPIRTWELPAVAADYGHAGVVWMYNKYKAGNEVWPVNVILNVASGKATFTDSSTEIFTGDEVNVRTESIYWDNDNAKASDSYYTSWNGGHDHRAETAQYYADGTTNHTTEEQVVVVEGYEPVPATCTEDGFSGRYFCTVCNSVSDWGHVIPATGHSYAIDEADGLMKCTVCGDLCNEVVDGKLYQEGALVQGFVEDKYYVDGVAQDYDGVVEIDGVYYEFDNGTSLGKYTGLLEIDGSNYFAKLGVLTGGWEQIDGDWYYFDEETLTTVPELDVMFTVKIHYEFEESGKLVSGVWKQVGEGTRYYYGPDFYKITSARSGVVQWAEIDGATYAFNGMGYRREGMTFINESNNPRELYEFTEDGKLVGKYTGIYEGIYYTDGKQGGYTGVYKDGDDYYYIMTNGKVYVGSISIGAAKSNGYVESGTYVFGEDGKMIIEKKNGIIDGYYYVNGEIVKGAGVVLVDHDLYYIMTNGKIYVGTISIGAAKSNGYLESGSYTFGADGKLVIEEPKNGVVDGYYYVDGEIVKGAGVVKVDNDLYYVMTNGKVYVGTISIGAAKSNGYLESGSYTFGADGKLVIEEPKNGVINGYYYEDGEIVKGVGVVKVGDDLYYVMSNGKVYVGTISIGAAKSNGYLASGSYTFGADGKLVTA